MLTRNTIWIGTRTGDYISASEQGKILADLIAQAPLLHEGSKLLFQKITAQGTLLGYGVIVAQKPPGHIYDSVPRAHDELIAAVRKTLESFGVLGATCLYMEPADLITALRLVK